MVAADPLPKLIAIDKHGKGYCVVGRFLELGPTA
jgi:hypothetical protein